MQEEFSNSSKGDVGEEEGGHGDSLAPGLVALEGKGGNVTLTRHTAPGIPDRPTMSQVTEINLGRLGSAFDSLHASGAASSHDAALWNGPGRRVGGLQVVLLKRDGPCGQEGTLLWCCDGHRQLLDRWNEGTISVEDLVQRGLEVCSCGSTVQGMGCFSEFLEFLIRGGRSEEEEDDEDTDERGSREPISVARHGEQQPHAAISQEQKCKEELPTREGSSCILL